MKVILMRDVKKLGDRGTVVDVKDGYARNFLLPKKIALDATPGNIKLYEVEKKRIEKREMQEKEKANELAGKIESVSLTIARKCGEEDKLFGSVTSADIHDALKQQGVEIDKRDIILDDPLKSLGTHEITVKVYKDISAKIKLLIEKE